MSRSIPIVFCAGAAALVLGACELFTGPPIAERPSALVSDPNATAVTATGAVSLDATAGAAAASVAYVSLPPGTVPDGVSAALYNPATNAVASARVIEGGFDPVGVGASPGDTVEIVVRSEDGIQLAVLNHEVPPERRPVVVRTSPPRGKRDVVLNSVLVVVFSEPVDGATVGTATVRLLRSGAPVAAGIELSSDGLSARLRPGAFLSANTQYTLQVTTGVSDLDGHALEAAVSIDFRTGATIAEAASIVVTPDPLRSVPYTEDTPWGGQVPLRASVRDAAGNELADAGRLEWRSSDTEVLTLGVASSVMTTSGDEMTAGVGARAGSATITVTTSDGVSGTASVIVEDQPFETVTAGYNGLRCLLTGDRAPYCVGSNHLGQLGLGFASALHAENPLRVVGDVAFRALSTGYEYVCAVAAGGDAYCWGDNSYGQLGDGTMAASRSSPARVAAPGVSFASIGAGLTYTCALSSGGTAYCWGAYEWAAGSPGSVGPVPTAVPGDRAFGKLAVGGSHACGLEASGAAYCWGANEGRLGSGTLEDSSVPLAVAGGHSFVAIAASEGHTCALTEAGEAYCWGSGGGGISESGTAATPIRVDLPSGVALVEITAGWMLTCGLTADGAAFCWGWTWPCDACEEVAIPARRVDDAAYRSIAAGEADLACGVTTTGDVRCWRARDLLP